MSKRISVIEKVYVSDSSSNRRIDDNGFMHISDNILSNAEISEYVGKEIEGYQNWNLEPNKVYKVLRDEDELSKASFTFNGLPLMAMHIQVSANSPKENLTIGSIGTDVKMDGSKMIGSLSITRQKGIDMINSGIIGLSCSYSYVPIIEDGVFKGQKYDIKMTEISGNHVALVDDARVGIARVSDDNKKITKLKKEKNMFKLGNLFKIFAKDSDVSKEDIVKAVLAMAKQEADEFEGGEAEQLENIAALIGKLETKAEDEDDETKANDEDKTDETKAEDEDEEDKTKVADEEDVVVSADEDMDEEKASASDSKTLFKKIKAFDSAVNLAEKVIGKVNRDSFNYNSDKLLTKVLKQKGIACDSKNYNQKLAMVEVLSQTKTVAPKISISTKASDSKNTRSVFDILKD